MSFFFFDTLYCQRKRIQPICPNFNFIIKEKQNQGQGFQVQMSLFLYFDIIFYNKKKWDQPICPDFDFATKEKQNQGQGLNRMLETSSSSSSSSRTSFVLMLLPSYLPSVFCLSGDKDGSNWGGGGSRVGRNIEFLYAFVLHSCNELHGTGNSTALRNEKIQPSLFLWRNSAYHVCFLLNVLHPHCSVLQQPLTSML